MDPDSWSEDDVIHLNTVEDNYQDKDVIPLAVEKHYTA